MESHSTYFSLASFTQHNDFRSIQVSAMYQLTVQGVFLPSGIPLYGYTTVCTPAHHLMGAVYFPSAAYEPHWYAHSCTSFCVDVVPFLLGKYLGVERLERVVGT